MTDNIQETINRISMVLTKEEVEKIHVVKEADVQTLIFDVHGLTVKEAKRSINNLIALNRNAYNLRIIHGYNHGTAIKEMVNDIIRLDNSRIIKRTGNDHNLGITNLEIAPAI